MARTIRHLVVDGSNIATESRTLPSLAQLDEAVRAVQAEDPDWQVTVIVDATFSHRIDASERKMFEDANNAGEIITPPAGAVGRGDAFILQVAEKADAAVLSNDSFQEFHGEHPWLFDEGRLIGGKPVGDLGWVFVPRVPVRGPASRRATRGGRDTKKSGGSSRGSSKRGSGRAARADSGSGRAARADSGSGRAARVKGPAPKPTAATPPPAAKKDRRGSGDKTDRRQKDRRGKTTDEAKPRTAAKKSAATDKKGRAESGGSGRTKQTKKDGGADRSSSKQNVQELNSPRDFMLFVTQHSIGDEVTAVVDRFSSHGCYLRASSAQCYLPSSAMGDPPPSRARDVVSLGQTIIARVESLDSDRRGINVVLVRTITDDSNGAVSGERDKQGTASAGKSRGSKQGRTSQQLQPVADESAREENLTRSKPTVATKKTAKKASKRPAAKKATKKRAAKATKSARASKAAARKATKKAAPKKAAAKKATAKKATKKAAKKRPAAKKAAKKATKKAAPKKAAKKRPAAKKAAKKATKKAAPRKAAKKRPAAKKATKKAAPRKAAKKATKKAAKKR